MWNSLFDGVTLLPFVVLVDKRLPVCPNHGGRGAASMRRLDSPAKRY